MIFNSDEILILDKDGVEINKRLYIPRDKINIVEEAGNNISKINGKLVRHSFDDIVKMIETYK